jgi:hypothetical protein
MPAIGLASMPPRSKIAITKKQCVAKIISACLQGIIAENLFSNSARPGVITGVAGSSFSSIGTPSRSLSSASCSIASSCSEFGERECLPMNESGLSESWLRTVLTVRSTSVRLVLTSSSSVG